MGLSRGKLMPLFILLAQCVAKVTSQDLGIVGCPLLPVRLAVPGRTDMVVGTWTEATTTNSDVVLIDRSHIPGEAMFPVGFTDVEYTFRNTVTGEEAICSFRFYVFWAGDNQPPQIQDCPQDITRTITSSSVTTVSVSWTIPTATDNAGPVRLQTSSHQGEPPFDFSIGTTPVTYTFEDTRGLVATCEFNVNIMEEDRVPPVIACPGDQSEQASIGETQAIVRWSAVTATDNAGTPTLISMEPAALFGLTGGTFSIGITNVRYVYSDVAGNLATCAFNVEVRAFIDIDPPVVSCQENGPPFFTVASGDNGQAFWPVPMVISDDSLPVQTVSNFAPGDFFPIGSTRVEYSFTDRVGNEANCAFTVVVQDTTPPVFNNCPQRDITADILIGQVTVGVSWVTITAVDNSGLPPSVFGTHQSGSQFPQGSTMVSVTAEDGSGNQAICTFNVVATPGDVPGPPIISGCPTTMTLVAPSDQSGATVSWTEPTAETDLGVPTRERSHIPPAFFPIGRTEVVYTFTDLAGNFATCTFDVIVQDVTPPDISNCPSSPIRASLTPPQTMTTVTFTPPIAADNSQGVVTDDCTHNSGNVFPEGTTLVICEFTDESGNSNICMFQVIVEGGDPEDPVITNCPNDITRPAEGPGLVLVMWPPLIVTDNSGIPPSRLLGPPDFQDLFAPGTSEIVTYIYSDAANNIAECMFTVTIVAPSGPMVDCSGLDITVTAPFNQPCVNVELPSCSPRSNVLTVIQVSQSPPSRSCFSVGTTTVTNIFRDSNGLEGSGTFTVTVIPDDDDVPPVVDCSGEGIIITAQAGAPGITVTDLPRCSATDNSGQVIFVSQNPSPGDFFPIGDTTVTVVYRDPTGNTGVGSYIVTVRVITPVNIVCPNMQTLSAIRFDTFLWSVPACAGGVGPLSTTCNPPSGSTFDIGTSIVTCICTDTSGMSDTCTFPVTVDDDVPPVVDCNGEGIIITAPAGAPGVTVTDLPRCSATDNSGQVIFVSQNPSLGDFFPIGDTTVTVVYRDPSGNTGVGSYIVTVQQEILPVNIVCPNVQTLSAISFGTFIWSGPACTGGVGPLSSTCNPPSGSTFDIGTSIVTCVCTDTSGMSDTCMFPVTVVDTEDPVVDCSGDDVTTTAPAGASGVIVTTLSRCRATDNSGEVDFVTQNPSPGFLFPIGDTMVTVVYRDPSGNTGVGMFTVRVQEEILPVNIVCPNVQTLSAISFGTFIWSGPACTGGVGPLSSTCNPPSGSTFDIGTSIVTCICTDTSGMSDTCTFPVTVVDTEDPIVDCSGEDVTTSATAGAPGVIVTTLSRCRATDNSGQVDFVTQNPSPGFLFPIGDTMVTVVYRDPSGNTGVGMFTVRVQEVILPVNVVCPNVQTLSAIRFDTFIWSGPSCTGGVGPLSTTCNPPSGSTFDIGTSIVTCVCTDTSGISDTCTFPVTVVDTEDPIVDCSGEDVTTSATAGAPGVIVTTLSRCSATDNSGQANFVSQNPSPGDFFLIGDTTVTVVYRDPSGNTGVGSFIVTVRGDTVSPVVDCNGIDVIQRVPCGTTSVPVTLPTCTASDNSNTVRMVSQFPRSGSLFDVGTTLVTNIFADLSGNQGTGTFVVTVTEDDCEDPVVDCSNINIIRMVPFGTTEVIVTYPLCTATDNSGIVIPLPQSPLSGSPFPVGTTTIINIFEDPSGNQGVGTFTVTVIEDAAPPEISCPTGARVVTQPSGVIAIWSEPFCEAGRGSLNVRCDPPSGSVINVGQMIVTCTCTDSRGAEDMCVFAVDTQSPEVDCSGLNVVRTISLDTPCVLITLPTCRATDNSGTVTPLSQSPQSPFCFPDGTTTVFNTFQDPSGNEGTGTFTVTIVVDDPDPPEVDCSGLDIVRNVAFGTSSTIIILPTCRAMDDSGTVTPVSQSPPSGSPFPVGTTTIINIFEDPSGNQGIGTFTVTVIEDIPIMMSCPDVTSLPLGDSGTAIGLWGDPTCTGGREPLDIRCDRQSGNAIPLGVTTVTCTCTDSRGEEKACSFMLVGVDDDPPEVDCSGLDIVRFASFGTSCVLITLPTCTATDNSGTATPLPQSPPSPFCFPVGTETVMNTFQDPSGNEGTGTFTVTVIPDPPVVISCPTNGRSVTQGNLNTFIGVWSDPTCTGGRDPLNTRCDRQSGNVIPLGITTVTCTCTDSRGEGDMCSFQVEVVDNTPPTILTCPDDIIRQSLITRGGDIISFEVPTAFDASGSVEVVNDPVFVPGSYFPIGTTSVTYIFADSSDNRASCTFVVTVIGVNPCDNSLCLNGGVCIAVTLTDSRCVCTGCFTGPSCQISAGPCGFNRCENGGTCQPLQGSCQASFCNCPPCYTGLTCQTRVGACRNHECQNGAVCIPASLDCNQYTCQCASCFMGDFCQIAIPDPCDSSPCLNGGQCSRSPNSCSFFSCTCSTGFSGELCEQVVSVLDNPCNNFPCLNQGSCVSFGSTYKCICRPGFLGRNCQQAVGDALSFEGCSPNSPCQNGGTCFESYTSTSGLNPRFSQYICICNSGFTGERCAIPVNQAPQLNRCLGTNICQNGGTCRNSYCSFQDRIDFFCECPIGFIGEVCSIPYGNPCSTPPCGDGGVCQPFNQYFVCSCLPGYSGITCDQIRDVTPPTVSGCPQQPIVVTAPLGSNTAVVSWSEPTASDNSGQTVELVSVNASPGARYPVGTHQVLYIFGDAAGNQNTCSFSVTVVRATDACNPNPCQNGGNCRIINGRFSCICPSGFTGQTCAQATDACNPNPCQNGGNCQIINGRFSCICPSGFTGQTCGQVISDNPCDSSPCLNGGTCIMLTSEVFVCLCEMGFAGPRCEIGAQDACSTRPCQNGGTCVPSGIESFVCLCNTGFQGLRCQSGFGGVDVTPPDISNCPGNTTVTFPPGVTFVDVSWTAPTAVDESPPIQEEQNRISPAFLQRGQTLNVIYEFTDRFGNTATCSFFFLSNVL